MKTPMVTIGIVLCGNEKYFPYLFESLKNQTYLNIEVLLRDQSKGNTTGAYIREHHSDILNDDRFILIEGENKMHSGGQNDLINRMKGDYYVCGSNDMWYPPDFIEKVVNALEKKENASYGFATVKSMQWYFQDIELNGFDSSKTNEIDSCGIGIKPNHYFYDIGQGEKDVGQFDDVKDIFGTSGALTIFRKYALAAIKYRGDDESEYFDSLIHYKNDIDISYRLQWSGQKGLFLPKIKVWHDRQVSAEQGNMSVVMRIVKNRTSKSRWVKENSFWGHLVMMKKNFSFSEKFSLSVKVKTGFFLLKMFVFITLFEPFLWRQYWKYKKESSIIQKKNHLQKKVSAQHIESYMI